MQVVKVNVATKATSGESEVILEPVDAADSLYVACEHHCGWAVRSVKVVYMDVFLIGNAREHVSAVGELYLSAGFDGVRLEGNHRLGQNIAHLNLILHRDH